ncbi:MAG: extracellular solute-binding protein [Clostridiaceae bacterium]|nr:extracellular solute-binding protein [Clostridiaceae bacterium]
MKKFFFSNMIRMLCILITVGLLASCNTGTQTGGTNPDEKVTITISFDALNLVGGGELDDIFAEFYRENPNIIIESVPMVATSPEMTAKIASGNAPDLFRLEGVTSLPGMASKGLLLELDDYIAKSDKIVLDNLYDVYNVFRFDGMEAGKGPIYGTVKDWSIDTQMWINKKMFRDAGLRVPTKNEPLTYDELSVACHTFFKMNEDGEVVQLGLTGLYGIVQTIEVLLAQQGKSMWSEDFNTTTLLEPDTRKAVEYYLGLQKNGGMESPLNPANTYYSWFIEGKAAMVNFGYWMASQLANDNNLQIDLDDVELVPGPIWDKNKRFSACLAGTGSAIYKKTKHPDEAFKVFEYIHFGSSADTRAQKAFGLPIDRTKISLLPQDTPFLKMAYESVLDDAEYASSDVRINPFANFTSVNATFEKYYIPVLFGQDTLDNALQKINDELNILTKEGKEILGVD